MSWGGHNCVYSFVGRRSASHRFECFGLPFIFESDRAFRFGHQWPIQKNGILRWQTWTYWTSLDFFPFVGLGPTPRHFCQIERLFVGNLYQLPKQSRPLTEPAIKSFFTTPTKSMFKLCQLHQIWQDLGAVKENGTVTPSAKRETGTGQVWNDKFDNAKFGSWSFPSATWQDHGRNGRVPLCELARLLHFEGVRSDKADKKCALGGHNHVAKADGTRSIKIKAGNRWDRSEKPRSCTAFWAFWGSQDPTCHFGGLQGKVVWQHLVPSTHTVNRSLKHVLLQLHFEDVSHYLTPETCHRRVSFEGL